jgi:phage anti-repressor protein
MVERTERGRATRRHFIEMEQVAHRMALDAGRPELAVDVQTVISMGQPVEIS